ncbi:hypothetical protein [Cecembia calidifontis]|nr:hypothetical protein [Cecembia calidifontis]
MATRNGVMEMTKISISFVLKLGLGQKISKTYEELQESYSID